MFAIAGCSLFAPKTDWDKVNAENHAKKVRETAEDNCRIGGEVIARCMEVNGFPSAEAPAYQRSEEQQVKLRDCYIEQDHGSVMNAQQIYFAIINDGDKIGDDPGAKDCLARAEKKDPAAWAAEAWSRAGTTLDENVRASFKASCGWEARFERGHGGPWQIVFIDVPKKARAQVRSASKVFAKKDVPPYELRCSGELMLTGGPGAASPVFKRTRPETKAEHVEKCESFTCVNRCDVDNSVGCMSRCIDECQTDGSRGSVEVDD
jgi:hypothetical protein